MAEEWRAVLGHEGIYEVSDIGNVRSLDREVWHGTGTKTMKLVGRPLASFMVKGYLALNIPKLAYIHRLVCEAWHGPRPEGMECRHLDGNPFNNTPDNLRWGTSKENAQDTLRHGHHREAAQTHCWKGHEFSEANTYRHNGRRGCRACNRSAVARYEARKANAQVAS